MLKSTVLGPQPRNPVDFFQGGPCLLRSEAPASRRQARRKKEIFSRTKSMITKNCKAQMMKWVAVVFAILLTGTTVGSSLLRGAENEGLAQLTAEEKAEKALESLKQAYLGQDLETFFEGVSDDAYFNATDLKFKMRQIFNDFIPEDLNWVLDHSLVEKENVVLQTHWQRRRVNKSNGSVQLDSGQADFIFLVGEEVQLIQIRGNSPFE